jgi:predicted lipoprotein with Yx(FWY)xxD motif
MRHRSGLLVAGGILIVLGIAGCGSSAAAPPAAPKVPVAPVKTGRATVDGKQETVLTTTSGMTLYYFTPDTPTKSACTGHCAAVWPPLTTKATALKAPPGVPGQFTVVKDANGRQVAYNGHLLYTFARDKAPGQALGEGLLGKWFVATPNLAPATSSTSSSAGY